MKTRDTGTGEVLELMVLPALERGGYACRKQVRVGERIGGRAHVVDAIAEKEGSRFLVSFKWQQTSGTAEQKVPFEVICLAEALASGEYKKAYLVLGGEGWTLRSYYTSGALHKHLRAADGVQIVTLETFAARANQGLL